MTDIDLQKIHGLKLTIKWQTFWIIFSIAGSALFGSYRAGSVVNDIRNDYGATKKLTLKHETQIPEMKQKYFADSLTFMALIKSIR